MKNMEKTKKVLSPSFKREVKGIVGGLLNPPRPIMTSASISILDPKEQDKHFAPLKSFQSNEFLERLVQQMIYNESVRLGYVEDVNDLGNKTFLF